MTTEQNFSNLFCSHTLCVFRRKAKDMSKKEAEFVERSGVGATLMKSVSMLIVRSRKASYKRPVTSCQPATGRRRRRMPETVNLARSSGCSARLIESLKRRTRFSWAELDSVCKLFKRVTSNSGQQQVGQPIVIARRSQPRQFVEGIDRGMFRELLHNTFNVITEDALVERMFCCWDRECDGVIRLDPFVTGLDVFLRGNLRERTEFCFKVYDLNNDGHITKDEIFQLFKNSLVKQPGEEDPDESVRDLSEMALKKFDVDRDGKISFTDYRETVKDEPLLLEAFGQCLPTDENRDSFFATLQS